MKIPKTLKLGPFNVKVIITDDEEMFGDKNNLGRFDIMEGIIVLKKSINDTIKEELFFHEVFEALAQGVCYIINDKFTHERFSCLSTAIYQLLKENKLLKE